MRKIVLTVIALGSLAGCAYDPYYGRGNYTRDAVVGGALGAATGAVVGNAAGGRTGAIVGGAVGAGLGATIATEPYRRYDYAYPRQYYRHDYPSYRYGGYRYRAYPDSGIWYH